MLHLSKAKHPCLTFYLGDWLTKICHANGVQLLGAKAVNDAFLSQAWLELELGLRLAINPYLDHFNHFECPALYWA